MAHSSIQPIEIIDDEDAILIDDEREDEGEILEYGELQLFFLSLPYSL